MSPFTAKRRRANACRPLGPCPAPSITCASTGPRPVWTAAVSPLLQGGRGSPPADPRAGTGRDREGGKDGGKEGKQEGKTEGKEGGAGELEGGGRRWNSAGFRKRSWGCSDFRGGGEREPRKEPAPPGCILAVLLLLPSRVPDGPWSPATQAGPGRKLIGR